jgi:hypothetical protein
MNGEWGDPAADVDHGALQEVAGLSLLLVLREITTPHHK